MPLRCFIVDDNVPFTVVVSELLEQQDMAVVGTAATGDEALRLIEELRPDVTLVDIDLGAESGFTLVRRLACGPETPHSRTILISTHAAEDYAELIEASPALGFLSKSKLSAKAITDVLGVTSDGRAEP